MAKVKLTFPLEDMQKMMVMTPDAFLKPGVDLPAYWEERGFTPDFPTSAAASARSPGVTGVDKGRKVLYTMLRPLLPTEGVNSISDPALKSLIEVDIPDQMAHKFGRFSPKARRMKLHSFLTSRGTTFGGPRSESQLGYHFTSAMNLPENELAGRDVRRRFIAGTSLKEPPHNPQRANVDELYEETKTRMTRGRKDLMSAGATESKGFVKAEQKFNKLQGFAKEAGFPLNKTKLRQGGYKDLRVGSSQAKGLRALQALYKFKNKGKGDFLQDAEKALIDLEKEAHLSRKGFTRTKVSQAAILEEVSKVKDLRVTPREVSLESASGLKMRPLSPKASSNPLDILLAKEATAMGAKKAGTSAASSLLRKLGRGAGKTLPLALIMLLASSLQER